jgi:hypothetical protein
VTDSAGNVVIMKDDQESKDITDDNPDSLKAWTLNANKAGVYKITVENLGTLEMSTLLSARFNSCKKFQKLVKKTEMDEINANAEGAIGTLFHNMVELEHSESRLTARKESRSV